MLAISQTKILSIFVCLPRNKMSMNAFFTVLLLGASKWKLFLKTICWGLHWKFNRKHSSEFVRALEWKRSLHLRYRFRRYLDISQDVFACFVGYNKAYAITRQSSTWLTYEYVKNEKRKDDRLSNHTRNILPLLVSAVLLHAPVNQRQWITDFLLCRSIQLLLLIGTLQISTK